MGKRKKNPELDKQVLGLLADGLNYRQIGEQLGIPASSIPAMLERRPANSRLQR